jgi:septum formation protein
MGLDFTSGGVDVDETPLSGEPAKAMVLRLAEKKARAAGRAADAVVIGADTAVVLDGIVFGKPTGRDDALGMLGRLSGRSHQVLTGIAVLSRDTLRTTVSVTNVTFRDIDPDEALQYWQSGEPRDKAGAYAIQGGAGDFVVAVEGSYSGVVGLPVLEIARLLQLAGVEVPAGLKDEV